MIRAFLFDLDGTLLPISFSEFLPRYFALIQQELSHIFPGKNLAEMIIASSQKMLQNDGTQTNEEVFWGDFSKQTGISKEKLKPLFENFYKNSFPKLGGEIISETHASALLRKIKEKSYKTALATNAVFPRIAIVERLRWAELKPEAFDFISSYEVMNYCKPNPLYFKQIATYLKEEPENCLMIGNDIELDLKPANTVGMKTYLVTNDFQEISDTNFKPTFTGALKEILNLI